MDVIYWLEICFQTRNHPLKINLTRKRYLSVKKLHLLSEVLDKIRGG